MISHKHKFILTLLPKTGTTSLSRHACLKNQNSVHRHYDTLCANSQNYLKISTCRNPFSRVVSIWKFWNRKFGWKKLPTTGFSHFVKNYTIIQKKITHHFNKKEKIHFCTCVDGVAASTNGSLSHTDIDFWIRTENLQEDFDAFCDKVGIYHLQLAHANKTKHKHYTEYYNNETKQLVEEKFAKDIEYFGYEFGK